MNELEADILKIEEYIDEMIDACSRFTITEMVKGGNSISTVCRFRQRRSDIFKVNCLTLKRIASCMDQLESAENKREKHIRKLLNDFVRVHIITAINEDSSISINHRTMNKFKDASLDNPL